MSERFKDVIDFIRSQYPEDGPVPLHVPRFNGNEKKYLAECIDSTFVSYVGEFVNRFEEQTAEFTGSRYAVAVVNGTAALQLALQCAGVEAGEEVLTQALSFVATANAVRHAGADLVFLDSDKETLGMDPDGLQAFLTDNARIEDDGRCINRISGKRIAACVPMHVFGHPVKIERIAEICRRYGIPLIEDAAESLGSFCNGRHTGTFGLCGILSYNGNKTITCGGGGMIISDDEGVAARIKHVSTTAKKPHRWEYEHDEVGYNYRLPNVNAAVGCAQMEQLPEFLRRKRELAIRYRQFFTEAGIRFIDEPEGASSNFWLNAVMLESREERDAFLKRCHENGILCRPVWKLLPELPMYNACFSSDLPVAKMFESRIVNIPSSVPL
jgi:aminotransferase in exopolysaccharide biosynthesis